MKSQIKLYKDDMSEFYNFLLDFEIDVNTEVVDWRALMWRRPNQNQWTQAYDGRTRSGKNERDFLRVFGPDEDLVAEFYRRERS